MRVLFRPLLGGFTAALLAWAFVQIGSEMLEGDTHAADNFVLRAVQALRLEHAWLTGVMRDLSGLGSATVLTLLTTFTVGYLLLRRARLAGWLLAAAVVSGSTSVSLLKTSFGRPRPDTAFAELVVPGLSFPSGHAGNSAIVFLMIGALLAGTRQSAVDRWYIVTTAALLTLLVGISRIVLGVHWASDVLAGWAFGAAWALVWLLVAHKMAGAKGLGM